MYKLFLCLRYLKSRLIAYFAMLAVALCVAMMLIVVSVMNGFLHKIEQAAKGLYGDIVIEPTSLSGMAHYDQFISLIRKRIPEMQLKGVPALSANDIQASPFIYTGGILDTAYSDNRQMVQVAGIRLPERTKVSSFGEGLHFQKDLAEPSFDPPMGLLLEKLRELADQTERLLEEKSAQADPEKASLIRRLTTATNLLTVSQSRLARAKAYQAELASLDKQIQNGQADFMSEEKLDQLREKLLELSERAGVEPPSNRVILGLGLPGLTFRTEKGQTIRVIGPGERIALTLIPLGRQSVSAQDLKPIREEFTIVDDCRTDVSSIDSNTVYLPFETLQRLNNMGAQYSADEPGRMVSPPRCSQLHVKVPDNLSEPQLAVIAGAIEGLWQEFAQSHPDATPFGSVMTIQTWRQRQVALVSQIASQRTLVVIMFGVISMVSVVLIFVIFYMIVFQKTKDIGVMKAVGASSGGVAGIFLTYGAAIGLVGSIFGSIGGYFFVKNINPIHDWVGRTFGLVVWNREWFMFDNIPSEVEPVMTVLIVGGAVVAGLVGALLPATLAGRMQPVEALRYE